VGMFFIFTEIKTIILNLSSNTRASRRPLEKASYLLVVVTYVCCNSWIIHHQNKTNSEMSWIHFSIKVLLLMAKRKHPDNLKLKIK
jgi:hypothetical protein